MQQISQKHQGILSLGLLALVIMLLFSALVYPAIKSRLEFYERVDDLQFQYSRFNEAALQSESLKVELEQLKNVQTDTAGFLEEKPEALAAADLQKQIKTLVDANDGNLISTQVVQNRDESVFPKITIKVHMRGNIEALQKLLYQFAANDTMLLTDNLLIQKRRQGGRRARSDADLLEIRLDVSGFIYQSSVSGETP